MNARLVKQTVAICQQFRNSISRSVGATIACFQHVFDILQMLSFLLLCEEMMLRPFADEVIDVI